MTRLPCTLQPAIAPSRVDAPLAPPAVDDARYTNALRRTTTNTTTTSSTTLLAAIACHCIATAIPAIAPRCLLGCVDVGAYVGTRWTLSRVNEREGICISYQHVRKGKPG